MLTVSGRRFAAGLYWLERGSAASVARSARAFGRPWHVHWGEQTGYAADEEETPKRLAFDEFHRTGGAHAVRAQVERDAREARKHGVRLCLASQRHDDFGEALVELANRIWVLGAGGKAGEMETLSKLFELSGTVADAVRFRLTGPVVKRTERPF